MMLKLRMYLVVVPATALAFSALAADSQNQIAYTDPAQAGPDIQVQGEYVGQVITDEGKIMCGVQVVALGDGKFDAVAYPGGLPGAGGDVSERVIAPGKTTDGVVTFATEDGGATGTLRDQVITVRNPQGEVLGTLKKIERASPTLGEKPPQGATVLFDGTGTEHFVEGRMTESGLLMVGTQTKQRFQDFKLHLEFRTPFMPFARGQGRGNSGMYLQGRYEVQILDSFGLEGRSNECGGIYKIAAPQVNMCFPPLSWQTYDVEFTAARFDESGNKTQNARLTVLHNGVAIHKDLELPDLTAGGTLKTESAEPGPLYLQDHHNPVHFRNIWVVEK